MSVPAAAPVVVAPRVLYVVLAVLLALTVLTLTGVFDGVSLQQTAAAGDHAPVVGGRLVPES